MNIGFKKYRLSPDPRIQKFVRFGFVGGLGAIVNLVVLTACIKLLGINELLASVIAIEVSIIFNFFLNHYFTFNGYDINRMSENRKIKLFKNMMIFNVGMLGGAIISFATFGLLVRIYELNFLLADCIAILTAMSWNYWVSVRFVWRAVDRV